MTCGELTPAIKSAIAHQLVETKGMKAERWKSGRPKTDGIVHLTDRMTGTRGRQGNVVKVV
jgi:hypothetical protein